MGRREMSDNPLLEKVEQNPVTGALPLCRAKPSKKGGVNRGKAPIWYGLADYCTKSFALMV